MPKVTVLGNGGWGNAMAVQSIRGGNQATIWGHNSEYLAQCAATHTNPKYLPNVDLPPELIHEGDLAAALEGADIVLVAIPTAHLRAALTPAKGLASDASWFSLTKGIESSTLQMPREIISEASGVQNIGVLSGPNIANEIVIGKPASAVVAHATDAEKVQRALSSEYFRLYRSTDIVGAELGGVVKNVIAIAAGIIDGMDIGDNAKAILLVRGALECKRLGVAMGAEAKTFDGLTGVGDLFVTCTSPFGRNRGFGERLGKGMSVDEALDAGGKVVEGYHTAKSILTMAAKYDVEMPICEAVHDLLYEGDTAEKALLNLMTRDHKEE